MQRCVIVGGAGIREYQRIRESLRGDDWFVYCDGGLKHVQELGREPNLIVGDFDSHEQPATDTETIVLPCEKDDTDTFFAVKEAVRRGYDDFLLIGVIGERLDHTLANLQGLAFLAQRGAKGYLYDQNFAFTAIWNDDLFLPPREEGIFSVFALGEPAEGVSILGGRYPLENDTLSPYFPLGVSNHFEGQPVSISVKKGCLLVGWEL